MQTVLRVSLLVFLALAAMADEGNPLTTHNRFMYGGLKAMLLSSAEKMPEAHYAFKPIDTVRGYGQILGHVADSQYAFCSMALGEKNPAPKIEQTKTSKADLIAALKESFAYCDRAYAMPDAVALQTVKAFRRDTPKLGILSINNAHSAEHYGNLATYLRMQGIVPPTSDPEFKAVP